MIEPGEDVIDEILRKDLTTKPSRAHNMFKRVIKKIYKEREKQPERFFNECASYLVSITARQRHSERCPYCKRSLGIDH